MGEYRPGSSIHSGRGNGKNQEIVLNEMGASGQQHSETDQGMSWETTSQKIDVITEDYLLKADRDVEHQMEHHLLDNKGYDLIPSQL